MFSISNGNNTSLGAPCRRCLMCSNAPLVSSLEWTDFLRPKSNSCHDSTVQGFRGKSTPGIEQTKGSIIHTWWNPKARLFDSVFSDLKMDKIVMGIVLIKKAQCRFILPTQKDSIDAATCPIISLWFKPPPTVMYVYMFTYAVRVHLARPSIILIQSCSCARYVGVCWSRGVDTVESRASTTDVTVSTRGLVGVRSVNINIHYLALVSTPVSKSP